MRYHTLIGLTIGCLTLLGPAAASAAETGAWLGITNNQTGLNGAPAGTGTVTLVDGGTGEVTGGNVVERAGFAMAWHPEREQLFGVQGLGGGRQALVRVDRGTLALEGQVGVLVDADDPSQKHRISAMGVAEDGTLYGISVRIERVGGFKVPMGVLVDIDLDTAVATTVGELGIPVYSRGGTVADGAFQLITNVSKTDKEFHLYAVDLTTGEAAHTGATGIYGKAAGVGVDESGTMMAVLDGVPGGGQTADGTIPTRSYLYEVDPRDAGWSLIGDTGVDRISGFTWLEREVEGCGVTVDGDIDVNDGLIDTMACATGDVAGAVCSTGTLALVNGSELASDAFVADIDVDATSAVAGQVGIVDGDFVAPELDDTQPGGPHLTVHKNDTVTLTTGVYEFQKIDLKQGSEVLIDGDVEIHVNGLVQLHDAAMNLAGDAGSLTLYVHGNKVHLKGGSVLVATVVAPEARIQLQSGSELYGVAWADSLTLDSGSAVHIDECLLGVTP